MPGAMCKRVSAVLSSEMFTVPYAVRPYGRMVSKVHAVRNITLKSQRPARSFLLRCFVNPQGPHKSDPIISHIVSPPPSMSPGYGRSSGLAAPHSVLGTSVSRHQNIFTSQIKFPKNAALGNEVPVYE